MLRWPAKVTECLTRIVSILGVHKRRIEKLEADLYETAVLLHKTAEIISAQDERIKELEYSG